MSIRVDIYFGINAQDALDWRPNGVCLQQNHKPTLAFPADALH